MREIDKEIDDHDGSGNKENDCLDHWQIPLTDSQVDQTPEPGEGKNLLNDDRPSQKFPNLKSKDSENWNHRIPKNVFTNYDPLSQAFAPGGANIVLPKDLKERRPGQPRQDSGPNKTEG
jgi:hypothetical protein